MKKICKSILLAAKENQQTHEQQQQQQSHQQQRQRQQDGDSIVLSSAVWAEHHLHSGDEEADPLGNESELERIAAARSESAGSNDDDHRAWTPISLTGMKGALASPSAVGASTGSSIELAAAAATGVPRHSPMQSAIDTQPAHARSPSLMVRHSDTYLKLLGPSTFNRLTQIDEAAHAMRQSHSPHSDDSNESGDAHGIGRRTISGSSHDSPLATPGLISQDDRSPRHSPDPALTTEREEDSSHTTGGGTERGEDHKESNSDTSPVPLPLSLVGRPRSPSATLLPSGVSHGFSLRHLLSSELRSQPYERIFFDLFEEDIDRINTFFKMQEQFFLAKVDILTKQIHVFLQAQQQATSAQSSSSKRNETPRRVLHPSGGDNHHSDGRSTPHTNTGSSPTNPLPSLSLTGPNHSTSLALSLKLRSASSRAKYKAGLNKAVRELYRGLTLLKNFRILNFTGVVKILKKHDKVSTFPGVSSMILPLVQSTYFFASPVLEEFLQRVEAIYVTTFCDGDRKEAMTQLRPTLPPLSDWTIFSLGFTAGLCLVLLGVFIGLIVWGHHINQILPASVIAIAPMFRFIYLVLLAIWLWYQSHIITHTHAWQPSLIHGIVFDLCLCLVCARVCVSLNSLPPGV